MKNRSNHSSQVKPTPASTPLVSSSLRAVRGGQEPASNPRKKLDDVTTGTMDKIG